MAATQDRELAPLLQPEGRRHIGPFSALFIIINRQIGAGIFSIPSGIYELTGSVGWSLVLWLTGGLFVFAGFSIYLEYGLQMPHSGAEYNYLARVYKRPKYLVITIFALTQTLLSFSTSNSYAFGLYIQMAFGSKNPSETLSRYIACATIISIAALHSVWPNAGKVSFNVFGACKVFILLVIAVCGLLVYAGLLDVPDGPTNNFSNMWGNDGFGGDVYSVSVAILRISYSYRGWETLNLVLGEVRKPFRTMALMGPLAVVVTIILYMLCNLAYFLVIPKDEMVSSGIIVAGTFFQKLFGDHVAARLLPLLICISNIGNVLVVSFATARLTNRLGEHHLLPFSKVFASRKPFGTPIAGLAMHTLMTVLTVLLPPPGQVYQFVVDLSTYQNTVVVLFVTVGLMYLHRNAKKEQWGIKMPSWRTPTVVLVVYFIFNLVMIVFPWVPPTHQEQGKLVYYASPLGSVSAIGLAVFYWLWWRRSENAEAFERETKDADDLVL